MNYYAFHIGDYRSATMHLTNGEDLAYRRALDWYYDTEKPIPLDTQWVSRRLRVEASDLQTVLNDFFIQGESGWSHSRCEKEMAVYAGRAEKNRANGSKGGRPSAKNTKTAPSNNPVGFQSVANGEAVESELNPNQEPITNNQEPVNTEAKASLSPSKPDDVPAVAKESIPPCPHTELIDLFAEQLPNLPQPKPELWNGSRAASLKSRWRWVLTAKKRDGTRYATSRAEALDWFNRFFGYVAESDFLTGRDGKWTGCDLGWLCNETNFAKVVSGNYTNKEAA